MGLDRILFVAVVSFGLCLGFSSSAPAQEMLFQSDRDVEVQGPTDRDYITSNSAQDPHGVRVCDLNGDGSGDLVVGAPDYSSHGRVYVVFGEEAMSGSWDLLSDADFTVTGSTTSKEISGSLACGDVNGDGIEDLVIGAPEAGSSVGAVYVVFGSGSLSGDLDLASASADITVTGVAGGLGHLGRDVVVADFNGDGIGDLVIGNPYADPDPDGLGARTDAGMVHVLFGSATPPANVDLSTDAADVTIHGVNENGAYPPSRIGHRVDTGDFDGDGIDDIVFGYYHAETLGWSNPGYPGIFFGLLGSSTPAADYDLAYGNYDFRVFGSEDEYGLGEEIATGDLDGDGYDDLVLLANDGNPPSVHVVAGSAGIAGTNADIEALQVQRIQFDSSYEGYGRLATGDVNLDGRADLLIGNPYVSFGSVPWAGEALLFLGKSTLDPWLDADNDADLIVQGEDSGGTLGQQVAMGSLNGAAASGLILAAPAADVGSRNGAGKVVVFHGFEVMMALLAGVSGVPIATPIGIGILMLALGTAGVRRLARGARKA